MTKVMPALHPTRALTAHDAATTSHLQVAMVLAVVVAVAVLGFLLRLAASVFRVIVESAASTVGVAVGLIILVVVLIVTLFGRPTAADDGSTPEPTHPAATR